MLMIKDVLSVLFPDACVGCNVLLSRGEKRLCTFCRHQLPFTDFHNIHENPIKRSFYGRIPIRNATALFFYTKKGIVQQLVYSLKYRGNKPLGTLFGGWLGEKLAQVSAYQNIDLVTPVPLHPFRKMKRGYNQVDNFGKMLAKHLDCSFSKKYLDRKKFTHKLAFKGLDDRFSSLENAFRLKNKTAIKGKHILLVDDIITTGATIEGCTNQLIKALDVKVSIAAIAAAE